MAVADRQQGLTPAPAAEAAAAPQQEEARETAWTRTPRRRFLTFGLIVLLLAALLGGWLGLRHVEQRQEAEIVPASRAIGSNLAQQFELALSIGIPFEGLVGVEPFLATTAGFDERIGFAALFDAAGNLRHAAGPEAGALPQRLDTAAAEIAPIRLQNQLATAEPLYLDDQLQGYVLVGISAVLPATTLRDFALAVLLIVLALGVLLREVLSGMIFQGLERPAQALARLARAAEGGDLSRTTWLDAPGRFGHLLEGVRQRFVSVNGRFHNFLLSAFATRAGHFDPGILREVTEVVRRCLANYRLPPVAGAWPVPLSNVGLFRMAAFTLLLGECLLAPTWRLLPVLEQSGPLDAVTLVVLPLLLAVPLGSETARRLLVGFTQGLIFTAGALIAAAAALSLALADSLETLVVLRLLSGFGIGMALWPFAGSGVLAHALAMAFVAGAAPGFLALLLVGPEVTAPIAALVMAVAGLLVGQMLPSREEEQEEKSGEQALPESEPWSNLLPAAAVAATGATLPLIGQQMAGLTRVDVTILLYGGLGILLAAFIGRWIAGRPAPARPAATVAAAAALLLAATAFAPQDGTFGLLLMPALLLTAAVFLGPRRSHGAGPAGAALAATGGFVASLLLMSLINVGAALLLPAALLLVYAMSWRRT